MIIAELPSNEDVRLNDLYSYDILDTQSESDFDELVELASYICQCPISLISLLDKDRQWFKARKGIEESETGRDVAFCSHSILQNDVMIVEDAINDIRFVDNPFVTGSPHVRFYAGAPIVSASGNKVGAICVIDNKPKLFTKEQERGLQMLSKQATRLLEIRRKNQLIRKRSEEIIQIKTQSIRKIIHDHEQDKNRIAHNLHEDLAQAIASSIFYLKASANDKHYGPQMIAKASQQLEGVLNDVRNLSYQLTPAGIDIISAAELVTEFALKTAETYPFAITVQRGQTDNEAHKELTIVAIRILEAWLNALQKNSSPERVNITIDVDVQLILVIEDDGDTVFKEREKQLFEAAIIDTVRSYCGNVDLLVQVKKQNKLTISLPLAAVNAE